MYKLGCVFVFKIVCFGMCNIRSDVKDLPLLNQDFNPHSALVNSGSDGEVTNGAGNVALVDGLKPREGSKEHLDGNINSLTHARARTYTKHKPSA